MGQSNAGVRAMPWYGWVPRSPECSIDVLLDPERDFVVRRRLPRVLAYVPSARSVDGLFAALEDQRFEVRFYAGRALYLLLKDHPDLTGAARARLGRGQPGVVRCNDRFGTAIACSTAAVRKKRSGSSTINSRIAPIGIWNTSSHCWPFCCQSTRCGLLFARSTPTTASSREPLSNIWRAQPRPIRGNCCFRCWKRTPKTVRAPRRRIVRSKTCWPAGRK